MKITHNNRDIETETRARFYPPAVKSIATYRAKIEKRIAAIPFRIKRLYKLTTVMLALSYTALLIHTAAFA